MNILIIGDIFGEVGKQIVLENLPLLKKELNLDLVIANAENVYKNGKGISYKDFTDLNKYGVDYFTLGNHAFKNHEINDFIDKEKNIIRPSNLKGDFPGKGYLTINFKNKKILLINLLGKELMFQSVRSPFEEIDKILKENKEYDLSILDFHAETTSEKKAMAFYVKKRVDIVYGTHTHVQTADEIILNKQAYITDIGMVGIYDSAIGVNYEEVISKLVENKSVSFSVKDTGIKMFNAILVEVDDQDFKPNSIKRINIQKN